MIVYALMGNNGTTWFLNSLHYDKAGAVVRKIKECGRFRDYTYKIVEVEVEV